MTVAVIILVVDVHNIAGKHGQVAVSIHFEDAIREIVRNVGGSAVLHHRPRHANAGRLCGQVVWTAAGERADVLGLSHREERD